MISSKRTQCNVTVEICIFNDLCSENLNLFLFSQDFTREQAKYAFEIADSNGDGEIDISEFIQLMFPSAWELVANIR